MVDFTKTLYFSKYGVDQIIGTFTDSFSVRAPTALEGTITVTTAFNTNINESTFFKGIYSVDGGTTWNDFQSYQVVRPNTSTPAFPMQLYGRSNANVFTISADNSWDYTAGTSYSYSVIYKVALIAKPTQGTITPQPNANISYFKSGDNYQKVLFDFHEDFSVAPFGTHTFSFPHNLGRIPIVRIYRETTNSEDPVFAPSGLYQAARGGFSNHYITTTDIFYTYTAVNSVANDIGTVFARVYADV